MGIGSSIFLPYNIELILCYMYVYIHMYTNEYKYIGVSRWGLITNLEHAVRTTRTCCSKYKKFGGVLAVLDPQLCEWRSAASSGCSNNMLWVFEHHVLGVRTTCCRRSDNIWAVS